MNDRIIHVVEFVLHYVAVGIPNVLFVDSDIWKTVVDVVSKTFGSITCFPWHTRVCWFSPRDVLNDLLHLGRCSRDELSYFSIKTDGPLSFFCRMILNHN